MVTTFGYIYFLGKKKQINSIFIKTDDRIKTDDMENVVPTNFSYKRERQCSGKHRRLQLLSLPLLPGHSKQNVEKHSANSETILHFYHC